MSEHKAPGDETVKITFHGSDGERIRAVAQYLDMGPEEFVLKAAISKMRDIEPEMEDHQARYAASFRRWQEQQQ